MHLVHHLKEALTGLHAAWVMWLLLVLLLVAISVGVERWLFFRRLRDDLPRLSQALDGLLCQEHYAAAVTLLSASPSAEAAVTLAGLTHADRGPTAIERALVGAQALQRLRLERGLAFLGTLGNNAPFIGLLGTVIGVIESFEALSLGSGAQVSSERLMGGIAEALVATAVGLCVALPAVGLYNYFQRQVETTLASTEALTSVLLAHAHAEPAPQRSAAAPGPA